MNGRRHPSAAPAPDAGMSLIEVLVALLIFAILSTGVVAGMVTITRMTDDNKARIAATGLAAQDIALARAVGDPFDLADNVPLPAAVTVGSRTYTVTRTVTLVTRTGADATCASSDLFYARVNVRVTWPGKLSSTQPVQDDTIVASQGRINDSATGSATVFVYGADGTPRSGVTVTMTPSSGGAALTAQPGLTDANGCARATGITPGTYTVTLSKSGYLDVQQQLSPTKTVIVTAGANQALSFQYDLAATFRTAYVSWPKDYSASTPSLPTNLDTTFLSTSSPYTTTAPASSVALHPLSGYTAIAGTPADSSGSTICAANDPRAWLSSTSNGPSRATGVAATATPATSGSDFKTVYQPTSSSTAVSRTGIPMGVVEIKYATPLTATLITATTTTPPSGTASPGCGTTKTYTFSGVTLATRASFLLPYGSYTMSATILGIKIPIPANYLTVPSNVASDGVTSSGVVTLDPRPAS